MYIIIPKRVTTKFDLAYFNVLYLYSTTVRDMLSMINHCHGRITLLSDTDILNISSKFLLHLECYLLSPKRHIKIGQ